MLRIFITTILLFIISLTYGQKLSKSVLLNDLNFLNEAVKNGHPVNYNREKLKIYKQLF